jgi:hypothetical protein
MFDRVSAFTSQFTPTDDGYLYYPSREQGGRLVTKDEFETLVAEWTRRTNPWKLASAIAIGILLWTFASTALDLPEWANTEFMGVSVAALAGWSFWAAYAPRRFLKDRAEVVPPRSLADARRQARSALNWPFVLFFLIASGAVFAGKLSSPEPTLGWWAWVVGSGLMFLAYLWIAILKFRDTPVTPQSSSS